MSSNILIEESCYLCDKLLAIAEFSGHQKRKKNLIYLCAFCSQGDASQFKRPAQDELIIATIKSDDGVASNADKELLLKWGRAETRTDRFQLLKSCYEAKKKMDNNDYQGSTKELFSIIKTIVKV